MGNALVLYVGSSRGLLRVYDGIIYIYIYPTMLGVYWDNGNKMEATIMGYVGFRVQGLGSNQGTDDAPSCGQNLRVPRSRTNYPLAAKVWPKWALRFQDPEGHP